MPRPVSFACACKASILAGVFAFSPVAAQEPARDQGADPATSDVAKATASLAVTPLRIELPTAATAETVQVRNTTDAPMAVQMRIFAWTQQDGADAYAPSTDLAVSPSIVSIPAGQTQIVRVLRRAAASQGEKRFRLVIDQLPDPAKARAGVAQTRVRFAIPMFVDRDKAPPASFAWRLIPGSLELRNTGGAAARIVQIDVRGADGRPVEVEQNTLRYVHGASTIAWPIEQSCKLGKVKVTAQIDGQTVDAEPVAACG
jgi:fimbrial chaperone protein